MTLNDCEDGPAGTSRPLWTVADRNARPPAARVPALFGRLAALVLDVDADDLVH